MICPRCHTQNVDNVGYCIACGEPLQPQQPNTTITENEMKNPTIVDNKTNYNASDVFGAQEEVIYAKNNRPAVEKLNLKSAVETSPPVEHLIAKTAETTQTSTSLQTANPVAPDEAKVKSDRVNPIVLFKLTIGAFFRPGTTINENTRVYTKLKPGFQIYTSFSLLTFIAFMITNVINGCFHKLYDINTGTYNTTLDFNQLATLNYLNLIVIGFLLSFGIVFLVAIVYYVSSFVTNRGLSLGRYLTVITLCLVPFLICTCIVAPIVSIPSYYLGIALTLFGIVYSFIILITNLNDLLTFKTTNQKIMYHTIILTIIFVIIGVVITFFLKDQLSTLRIIF